MTRETAGRGLRVLGVLASCIVLAGCETLAYYGQAARGQFELVAQARPAQALIDDPATPPALRSQLALALRIRAFASRELGLPDNGSYREYVELGRPFVVWNVFAAHEFSVRPEPSCFPVAGCVSYRGFFAQEAAARHAAQLRARGLDVHVGGVPAYSTLGWFDDPLLSSFIRYPEAELARLLFHELAHQRFYLKGDTTFNESFAVAVEREGLRRWLAATGREAQVAGVLAARERQSEFVALIESAKAGLAGLYAQPLEAAPMRAAKQAAMAGLLRDYAALKQRWGPGVHTAGYDRLLGEAPNNALLASISAYGQLVPGFERLLAASGSLPAFYAEVERIAALPRAERCAALGVAVPAEAVGAGSRAVTGAALSSAGC